MIALERVVLLGMRVWFFLDFFPFIRWIICRGESGHYIYDLRRDDLTGFLHLCQGKTEAFFDVFRKETGEKV